jgi:putative addiction module component (TIGR02574 family)
MNSETKKLLEEVLKLPDAARAALAGSLLDSLDETVDPQAEFAWSQEIARRIEDVDSGRAETISWSEARRLILGQ